MARERSCITEDGVSVFEMGRSMHTDIHSEKALLLIPSQSSEMELIDAAELPRCKGYSRMIGFRNILISRFQTTMRDGDV